MIKNHRPQGATHWQAGEYYLKTTDGVWYAYQGSVWVLAHPKDTLKMTVLRD